MCDELGESHQQQWCQEGKAGEGLMQWASSSNRIQKEMSAPGSMTHTWQQKLPYPSQSGSACTLWKKVTQFIWIEKSVFWGPKYSDIVRHLMKHNRGEEFPGVAVVTNYHNLDSLEQAFTVSQFWRPEVWTHYIIFLCAYVPLCPHFPAMWHQSYWLLAITLKTSF